MRMKHVRRCKRKMHSEQHWIWLVRRRDKQNEHVDRMKLQSSEDLQGHETRQHQKRLLTQKKNGKKTSVSLKYKPLAYIWRRRKYQTYSIWESEISIHKSVITITELFIAHYLLTDVFLYSLMYCDLIFQQFDTPLYYL